VHADEIAGHLEGAAGEEGARRLATLNHGVMLKESATASLEVFAVHVVQVKSNKWNIFHEIA
jgi:hypothetical protein